MAISATLWSIAALFGTGILGTVVHRRRFATRVIYANCLVASLIILTVACSQLMRLDIPNSAVTLPIGLPWVGARFRIDEIGRAHV